MESIVFPDETFPVYLRTESIAARSLHSEMAHWHEHIEILVVSRGSVCCRAAGVSFPLHTGDVCVINRRQMHQVLSGDGEDCCHKVLIVGTGLLRQNMALYEKYIRPMLEDPRFTHIRFDGGDGRAAAIAELVAQAERLDRERERGYELELLAAIHRLFRQLYLAYSDAPRALPPDGNAMLQQQMAAYIYENYGGELGLSDIAAAGSVSRSQCAKLFKQYTGLSPVAFLTRHRLERSLDRLRTTGESIAAVAQSCGFADQSYFTRLFLREYGCTPTAYRRGGLPAAG